MTPKIVVIGSSNVDLTMKMDRLPRRGETITDAVFMQTFGGKGANQAIAAAKAGGSVYMVNCVGDDAYSPLVRASLRQAGVNVDYVFQESGVATGTALIMVGGAGDNYLSVAPGANYRLSPEHIDRARSLIAEAEMVALQYEIREEALQYAVDLAARFGRKVMFNLAPAHPFDQRLLGKLHILVVNETEAEFVCGFPVDSEQSAMQAAGCLLEKGVKIVVITLGAGGSLVAAGAERIRLPAFQVDAVDTTAAGDVYCGSLATALAEGKGLRESITFASAAAAISVTRFGAQPSIPSREEIDKFLRG